MTGSWWKAQVLFGRSPKPGENSGLHIKPFMTAKTSTLWAEQLGKSYGGRRVVNGVSLKINQGEVVGLLGPNGAGKTTTFYMIVGLTSPDSGRILLNRADITDVPMYLRARVHR